MRLVELDACASTQDEARALLEAGSEAVAVSARSQRDGRGREGRAWQDPPGEALLLSVARRGPLPVSVLEDLPRRVATALLAAIGDGADDEHGVVWKAPNDLVAASDAAKVGGILVDARTVGDAVGSIIVGVGVNVAGPAFTTRDGRGATSLEQALGRPVDRARLLREFVGGIDRHLDAVR